jgi:hypothetical protein
MVAQALAVELLKQPPKLYLDLYPIYTSSTVTHYRGSWGAGWTVGAVGEGGSGRYQRGITPLKFGYRC